MSKIDFAYIPIHENNDPLILVPKAEFILEPKYYHWGYAHDPHIYLRKKLINMLRKAKNKLPPTYRFKIWDGYRSLETQKALWENAKSQVREKYPNFTNDQVQNEARKYIAIPDENPTSPPPHNTGGSVDLTLVDMGEELEMGSSFDEFFEKAYPFYYHNLPTLNKTDQKIKYNRDLLFNVMQSVGFRLDTDEWWHFDYGNQLWAYGYRKPFALYGSADKLYLKK